MGFGNSKPCKYPDFMNCSSDVAIGRTGALDSTHDTIRTAPNFTRRTGSSNNLSASFRASDNVPTANSRV